MRAAALLLVAVGLGGAALAAGPSLRDELLAIPDSARLGGDTTRPVASRDAYTFLIANAATGRQRPFAFGNRLFNTNWTEAPGSVESFDGLGPLFNRVSCSGCHTRDGRGRPPDSADERLQSMLVRVSLPGADARGGPKPHPAYGDQISEFAIPGARPEARTVVAFAESAGTYGDGSAYSLRTPVIALTEPAHGPLPQDLLLSARTAPAVFGLGLLEAVPDATLEALADLDDRDGDGISGKVNRVWNIRAAALATGRFGWKAGQPTLEQQNAGAAIGDIGLTTSLFPAQNCSAAQAGCAAAITGGAPEISDEFLAKLTLYTRTLAVPAQRNADDPAVMAGARLFRQSGCGGCHLPTLRTGAAADIGELANQTFHPYTDLLLHDMGQGLADNRPEFEATGQEWRTPPLWGLGLIQTVNGHQHLLHDGRARGVAEAILWHGGEAAAAKDAFRAMLAADRAALAAFLNSL